MDSCQRLHGRNERPKPPNCLILMVDDAMPWTGLGVLGQTSKVTKLERGCTVGLIAPF